MTLSRFDYKDILLLGYEDEENLGLRYIASYLKENGVSAEIIPIQHLSGNDILSNVLAANPKIIGFSMIFQRMLPEFASLISFLRKNGVKCHFTMGGHFPSIEYKKTLELIPELDTVVRHEGELTLLDLYNRIYNFDDWQQVEGIAFRKKGGVELTPSRPLIQDLDRLPFPFRNGNIRNHRGLGVSALIASRGCYYDCSFCSIHEFYSDAPGPKRRSRSPENVVKEMKSLFDAGSRIFIFKDDDFGMTMPTQKRWIERFADGLKDADLANRILWRISCRVDEIDPGMIQLLKDVGLEFLYLGIESGSDESLKTFDKHYTVSDIRRTLGILDKAGMNFEYGFMIFDPDSSISSLRKNISFLRELTDGGRVPVHFTKMFPYVGTPIARKLEKDGRLEGSIQSPDYRHLDPRLDLLETFFSMAFYDMMFDKQGLLNKLQFALFDAVVIERFCKGAYEIERYKHEGRRLVKLCNDSVLETMALATDFMEHRSPKEIIDKWSALEKLAKQEHNVQYSVSKALDRIIPSDELNILNVPT